MARTYKVYGCAHDPSGSLDVTLSVGGNEVFNGSITAETVGHGTEELSISELFTFDVDESLTGGQNWSMTITGSTDAGELFLDKSLKCNHVRPNMTIPLEYFVDKILAMDDPVTDAFTAEEQLYIDTTLGEALPADVRTKLQAGTSTPNADSTAVMTANTLPGTDAGVWYDVEGAVSSIQVNGEGVSGIENSTVNVRDGQTMTLTWDMTPQTFEYNPPLT